jgi:hypothetical protein
MVVISVDASNQTSRLDKMQKKTGVTFAILVGGKKVAREMYKIRGTPTTYIINGDGMIVFKHVGYYPGLESAMEKEIQSLVGGPA